MLMTVASDGFSSCLYLMVGDGTHGRGALPSSGLKSNWGYTEEPPSHGSVGADELNAGWRGVTVTRRLVIVWWLRGELTGFPSQKDLPWVKCLTCPEAPFPHREDPPQRAAAGFRGRKDRTRCLPRAGRGWVC